MTIKTDFSLGIMIALLGYMSCMFYWATFPLAHSFSLICLLLLLLTTCMHTPRTSFYHLSSLMIIPCLLWVVVLKHSYLYDLNFSVRILAYTGIFCTAFHILYSLYTFTKHTSSTK